jgi:hypothetical protein
MQAQGPFRTAHRSLLALTLVSALGLAACQKFHKTDTQPLYQSGLWSDTIRQLKNDNISDSEVGELIEVHSAGLSDAGCVQLIRSARARQQMFTGGDHVAGLLHAGVSEDTILQLDHLNQIGPWVGEAEGIRLGGYSDQVVLAIAKRRAAHEATVSGVSVVELKNAGYDEPKVLALIANGLTDEQAGQIVAAHAQTELPRGFVRGGKRSRQ